jgi:hypothetical protein
MARTINWSGQTWTVRSSTGQEGPGKNYWSNSTSSVWVDSSNFLHIKLRKDSNNRWQAAELYTAQSFKYGTFTWKIEGPTSSATGVLDKNVVLGLFTYKDTDLNNEIDIELARWGNQAWPNLNYTVYPSTASLWDATQKDKYATTHEMALSGNYTGHSFVWRNNQVTLTSRYGHNDNGDIIYQWSTPSDNPQRVPQSTCAVHMNLWIAEGYTAPSNGQEVEFIIHSFTYQA